MIIFVHQPEYIPWLGFFDKLARCDLYVVYDDAQYEHGGFHNRNRIRTPEGWSWLTVPITHAHPQRISDVKIAGDKWINKQLNIISNLYRKAPYFKDYYSTIRDALETTHKNLLTLNIHLIKAVAQALGINAKMTRSSKLPHLGAEKNEKLITMCKLSGADTYLCGSGGKSYIIPNRFNNENIKLLWHSYRHPTYRQVYSGFQPNMSIIDLLFNMGPEAKEVLFGGGVVEEMKAAEELMAAPVAIQEKAVLRV